MTDLFVTSPVPVIHSCLLIRMFLMKSGQINLFIDKKKNPTKIDDGFWGQNSSEQGVRVL